MWPTIEICANAGDSQRRKNIFLWPMISISMDSQGGHLGENPFHFREFCSTFLRVEPKHGHVYEPALVSLVCSQNWASRVVRPSECVQIHNNDRMKTFEYRDSARDGWVMLLALIFHQTKQIWGWSLPSSSLWVMENLVEVDLDYGTSQAN